MTFLPIVERELRLAARRPRTYVARAGIGAAATMMGLGAIMVSLSAGRMPGEMGRVLFEVLTAMAFGACLAAGAFITADCISQEKRDGTMGLLLLTDLRPHDIVLGKLAVTSLPTVYLLFTILPVLAWSFFLGGVSGIEFTRMMLLLLNSLFMSLSAGLLISALARNGRVALAVTGGLIAALTVLPLLLWKALSFFRPVAWAGDVLRQLSPYTVYESVWESPGGNGAAFVAGMAVLHAIGWAFLVTTLAVLPRTWQDEAIKIKFEPRKWAVWKIFQRRMRKRERNELLEENPVLYLAKRSQIRLELIWVSIAVGGFAILCQLAKLGPLNVTGMGTFGVVFGLHALVKIWVAWEASRRFAEDRNNGALELLLTSPIGEEKILNGWLIGLKRRFLGPIVLLFLADFLLLFGGFLAKGLWGIGFIAGMGLLAADTYTLCWVGFWMGLTAPTSGRAFSVTIGMVMMLPTVGFLGLMGMLGLVTSGNLFVPELGWVITGWFGVGYATDLGLCVWAIGKLRDGFRNSAATWATVPEPDAGQVVLLRQRLARIGVRSADPAQG